MGASAAMLFAMVASSAITSMNQPDAPDMSALKQPKPPQASKAPDALGQRKALAGAGQGGGAPGVSQTFLTGTQGVNPSMLSLGANTLLGGGSKPNG